MMIHIFCGMKQTFVVMIEMYIFMVCLLTCYGCGWHHILTIIIHVGKKMNFCKIFVSKLVSEMVKMGAQGLPYHHLKLR